MIRHSRDHKRKTRLGRLNEPKLALVVERNIRSIEEHRISAEACRTRQERIADLITRVSGSITFIWLHAVWFGIWIAVNTGLTGLRPFDPFPFGLLTTIVSLEAIFLSTFVLVSQNRQASLSDQRAQLDLQINLLAEHELTRMLTLQEAIGRQLGINLAELSDLEDLKKDVKPEAVLDKIEVTNGKEDNQGSDNRRQRR
jgi:uncharacterized membrane protein